MLSDELRLEHERLELGVAERVADGIPCYNQCLFGIQFGVLGVTRQPGLEIDGLAYVEEGVPDPILVDPAGGGGIFRSGYHLPGKLS